MGSTDCGTPAAWNEAASRLFRGWLDDERERNLLRFVFLDPAARALIPDWEDRALRLLAEFRADYGHTFRDPGVIALVDSLGRESALFAKGWTAQDVRPRAGGLRVFNQSGGGQLHFAQHTFSPSDSPEYKLVMLVPSVTARLAIHYSDDNAASAPSSHD